MTTHELARLLLSRLDQPVLTDKGHFKGLVEVKGIHDSYNKRNQLEPFLDTNGVYQWGIQAIVVS